jgi:hypothetical protein
MELGKSGKYGAGASFHYLKRVVKINPIEKMRFVQRLKEMGGGGLA